MDMTGAMPRSAWFEIRNAEGELLESIPATIDGGSISAELPVFAPGTRGSVQLCTEQDGTIDRDPPELEELPSSPVTIIVEMG